MAKAKAKSTVAGAGELTEQLTILHLVSVNDTQGGTVTTWETLAVVWGAMRALSAAEIFAARSIQSTQTYEGKIYYRVPQDIEPKQRVSWTPYGYTAPKVLEIHGVLPDKDEPRRFLILDVGEVVV